MDCDYCAVEQFRREKYAENRLEFCNRCEQRDSKHRYCVALMSNGKISNVMVSTDDLETAATVSAKLLNKGEFNDILVWDKNYKHYQFSKSNDFSLD